MYKLTNNSVRLYTVNGVKIIPGKSANVNLKPHQVEIFTKSNEIDLEEVKKEKKIEITPKNEPVFVGPDLNEQEKAESKPKKKTRRKRRTKAQMEADRAKELAPKSTDKE